MANVAEGFLGFLNYFKTHYKVVYDSFLVGMTQDEENDFILNSPNEIPKDIIDILRISNGQTYLIGGPFFDYTLLNHRAILERKNTYNYYFQENQFPLCEDGNGGFVIITNNDVEYRDYDGNIVYNFESLAYFLSFILQEFQNGKKIKTNKSDDSPSIFLNYY